MLLIGWLLGMLNAFVLIAWARGAFKGLVQREEEDEKDKGKSEGRTY